MKDVEFQVSNYKGDIIDTCKSIEKASVLAIGAAVSSGSAIIDTLVYSEKGARWLGGDDAVEQYKQDPEASVFERIEIKANFVGRVP